MVTVGWLKAIVFVGIMRHLYEYCKFITMKYCQYINNGGGYKYINICSYLKILLLFFSVRSNIKESKSL
jgi:hypothetical protein